MWMTLISTQVALASRADSNNSETVHELPCWGRISTKKTEKTGHFLSQIIPGMLAIIIAHFRDAFYDPSSA